MFLGMGLPSPATSHQLCGEGNSRGTTPAGTALVGMLGSGVPDGDATQWIGICCVDLSDLGRLRHPITGLGSEAWARGLGVCISPYGRVAKLFASMNSCVSSLLFKAGRSTCLGKRCYQVL